MLRRREEGRGRAGKLIARAAALAWWLDYRDEVESDFSVLHGVQSLDDIDGPRFFRLVERLAYYDGAVRGRLRAEMAEKASDPQAAAATAGPAPLPDITEVLGQLPGPNSEGFPWVEYRGGDSAQPDALVVSQADALPFVPDGVRSDFTG